MDHEAQHETQLAGPVAAPATAPLAVPAPALSAAASGMGNAAFGTIAAGGTQLASPQAPPIARAAVTAPPDPVGPLLARAVAARQGTVTAPTPSQTAFDMQQEADVAQGQELRMPAPKVLSMSAINDVEQARREAAKITAAQKNLFSAQEQSKADAKDEKNFSKEQQEHEKTAKRLGEMITENEEVAALLNGIGDLSQGASTAVKGADGNTVDATVGHEMRMSAFTTMYMKARLDYSRLEGTVNAFLAQHPKVESGSGTEAGKDLGRAVAGGGVDRSGADVHKQVEAATSGANSEMGVKVSRFRQKMDEYTKADYPTSIDTAVKNVAKKSNEMKNLAKEQALPPPIREDSEAEKGAKAEIKKINDDLAEARKAIDTIQQVATIALTLSGMPGLPAMSPAGAVPSGAVLTEGGQVAAFSGKTELSALGKSARVEHQLVTHVETGGKVASALDVDIGKTIKDDLAKYLTNYDSRMTAANGKLASAQYFKKEAIKELDVAKVAQLKTELADETAALATLVQKCERDKKAIRDAANEIAEHQAKTGKRGGVDIAAITQALAEVTIFIESVKAAKVQGQKEQELADEMVKRREKAVGKYQVTEGADATKEWLGPNSRIAKAEKEKAYYDATKTGDRWYTNMQPLRFDLWTDKVTQTPDGSRKEVKAILEQIDEYIATAEGFKIPLQNAMFGA
jgi:hypothetical protein